MFKTIENFVLFSILGFIGEFIHCKLRGRKSGKALSGPWCPLYGVGGLIILKIVNNLPKQIIVIYLVGVIVSTIIEYISSLILELLFKKRWWDYSNRKFNINGRICLENSLLFGILSILLVYMYIPIKDKLNIFISIKVQILIIMIIAVLMLADALIIIVNKKIS